MAWPRKVLIRATPEARHLMGPEWVEGAWRECDGPPVSVDPRIVLVGTGRLETDARGTMAGEVWEARLRGETDHPG